MMPVCEEGSDYRPVKSDSFRGCSNAVSVVMRLVDFVVFMEELLGGPPCARVLTAADRPLQSTPGSFLSSIRLWLVLLLTLWMFPIHTLWAQRTPPLEESAARLPDAPAPAVTVSEPQTQLHLTYGGLPLSFQQSQDPAKSRVRSVLHDPSYYRMPINTNAPLDERTGAAKSWGGDRFFIGGAPANGMTHAPAYGHAYHETFHGAHDLDYYSHHIPWAGSIVLRIGQQAQADPHIASVLKMVQPQF